MPDLTKLPLSVTSFSDFAANALIYVDKTDLVADLARFRNPFFLSRPRRFGKSTLVSTFHELFANGLDKFQGLKIVTDNLWSDKAYFISIFPKLKRILPPGLLKRSFICFCSQHLKQPVLR